MPVRGAPGSDRGDPAGRQAARRRGRRGQVAAALQEALKLLADGKSAQAAAKLQTALQADDQNIAAWKEWTALAAKSGKTDDALALAKKWVAVMPNSYQARNVLGALLEKQGKLKEALDQYTKSLQIEWNQPPISEAKIRIEKEMQK